MNEKAILVGLELEGNRGSFEVSMDELESLAESAGAQVHFVLTQSSSRIDPRYYIGSGKVDEVRSLVEDYEIDTVIFNNELSGSQIKNLEEKINAKIIDRTNLILDIFASRAKTTEAVLQVELAQAKYMLPRLQGYGNYLSRLAGGIGTRGPGEQQLETDRRHIRRQIKNISDSLIRQEKNRELNRQRRFKSQIPVVSMVGYTNVGKSTIMNQILKQTGSLEDKQVYADDRLFATLETSHRRIESEETPPIILADTVGLIRDLPIELVEAFKSTLEEISYSDLLMVVLDASTEDLSRQEKTIRETISDLKGDSIKKVFVYNKIDLVNHKPITRPEQNKDSIFISANSDKDIEELIAFIGKKLNENKSLTKVLIPYREGKLINDLIESHKPEKKVLDEGMLLELHLDDEELERLGEYIVEE